MKNLLSYLIVASLFMVSCSDDEELTTEEQLAKDIDLIEAYLDKNGIEATMDSSTGLFYVIKVDTLGEHPSINDEVVVNYEGRLLSNDEVFDEGQKVTFAMAGVIKGFQIGLQELSEGGSGTLYIPSYYGYGKDGVGSIPPNANLIFEIDLIEVK